MFRSFGFMRDVEADHQTQRQPDAGLFVVARTKHVDQIGNVMLQIQDPNQVSHRTIGLQVWPIKQHMNKEDGPTIVIPNVQIKPLKEPVHPLAQTVEGAKFSKSLTQTTSPSQNDGPKNTKHPVREEKQSSPPSQTQISKPRVSVLQSNKTSPWQPLMVHGEVHSKAKSMARSRLEKARFRLQGRIQQAMKLFGGKEISETQAKRKQVQF